MTGAWLVGLIWYGLATNYAPGVFEQVWDYREHQMPECRECVGYVALNECQLGQKLWVQNQVTGEWFGPLYSIDCAAPNDRVRRARLGQIIELDANLARRWQMQGPIWVKVTDQIPLTRIEQP